MKVLRSKTQHIHRKLLCQKPMLGQTEWRVQNGPITWNGVLPVTTNIESVGVLFEDIVSP